MYISGNNEDEDYSNISVIIPVYNKVLTVERAIESVLFQAKKPKEIIIVDDASTDGSLEIIEEEYSDRVTIIKRSEPGPGGYAARNRGAKEANARYLAFLDADDEWTQSHVEELSRLLGKGYRLASTSWELFSGDGTRSKKGISALVSGGDVTLNWLDFLDLSGRRLMPCNTITIGIERSLFFEVGGFPEGTHKRGGDVAFWLRLMATEKAMICSSLLTSIYHNESSTVTKEQTPSLRSCIVEDADRLINSSDDKNEIKGLQRLQIAFQVMVLLEYWKTGKLKLNSIRRLSTKPFLSRIAFFLLLSVFPSCIQRGTFSISKNVRRVLGKGL